jgi:hypothetical protein
MSQHTPGPFEADGTKVFAEDGYAIADTAGVHLHELYDSEKGRWASVPGAHRDVPVEEVEANARLFAAAPDLKYACVLLLEGDAGAAIDVAVRALAKADGRN